MFMNLRPGVFWFAVSMTDVIGAVLLRLSLRNPSPLFRDPSAGSATGWVQFLNAGVRLWSSRNTLFFAEFVLL
jgi:hypothetical protein